MLTLRRLPFASATSTTTAFVPRVTVVSVSIAIATILGASIGLPFTSTEATPPAADAAALRCTFKLGSLPGANTIGVVGVSRERSGGTPASSPGDIWDTYVKYGFR